jgi:predicted phage terminase large subunit-like protein
MEPLRHIHIPDFGAMIFRKTFPQVMMQGGLWDESGKFYRDLGGVPNRSGRPAWNFPSGARISFAYLGREDDKELYKGAQIPLIEFDQVEEIVEDAFFYLLSRNRSTCGIQPYVRGSCNPDPDSWLARFLEWWIDQDTGYAIESRSGVLRWMVRIGEKIVWGDSRQELIAKYEGSQPKSVSFIPSTVQDNKILMEADPGYVATLMSLPPVDMERLLKGNWRIRPAAGKLFNQAWFEIVDAVPADGEDCRFWDFAATAKEIKKPDPDFTASVKMRKVGGIYYVRDCTAEQVGPAEVERIFTNITKQDQVEAQQAGIPCASRWETEPGSAGKRETARMVQKMAGLDATGERPGSGDKWVRARPLMIQAKAGNVKLVRGGWNNGWLSHMHGQPDIPHDDIMDASVGAFTALVSAVSVGMF